MKFKSRVGERGQAVIPKPIRDALGIRPHEEIVFEVSGNRVTVEAQEGVADWFENFSKRHKIRIKDLDMDSIYEEMLERR